MSTPEWRSARSLRESFTESQLQVDALRRLLDLSGVALARLSLDGRILYATPRFAVLLGHSVEDLSTKHIRDYIADDGQEAFTSSVEAAQPVSGPRFIAAVTAAGEVPMLWTFRRAVLADTTQEIHISIQRVRPDEQEGLPVAGQSNEANPQPRPVTGRYHRDITPWEFEQTTALRSELGSTGAWVMDMARNSVVWSESAFSTLGVPVPPGDEPHVMGFEQWVHPDDLQPTAEKLYERFISPGRFALDVRGIHGDGRIRYIHALGQTYKTDANKETPDRAFGVFVDQTDQILGARALNMALRVDGVLARSRKGDVDLFADIVTAITKSGGFSYASYHERLGNGSANLVAHSGSNRFMATEEAKRVRDVLTSGNPAHLTEKTQGNEIVLASFFPVDVHGETQGVLVVWSDEPGQFTESVMQYLSDLAVNVGTLIENLDSLQRTQSVLRMITSLFGSAIESHSPYEAGRHARVSAVSRAIAEKMELSGDEVFGVEVAASIYDMGMLWLPDRLTDTVPEALTEQDMLEVHRHTMIGQSIAAVYDWPFPVPQVMGQHHENWDGSGYPNGLAGEQIALSARIVAAASVYERLVRRTGATVEDALQGVRKMAGTRLDPQVVDALEAAMTNGFAFKE